jgi:hypothetical protein
MATGSMTWACLLLALHAGAPEAVHINQAQFKIPIRVDRARLAEIRELRLWVSRDQGKNWDLSASAKPDQDAFTFTAPRDGEYWFSIAVIDPQGRQDPVDIYQAPVGQRIIVDTVKPEVRLTAERRGDEVAVRWEVREDYPNLGTFRLEYRAADAPSVLWTPVQATPGPQGQAAFRVAGPGAVVVRLQLQDLAENTGVGQVEVAGLAPPPPPLSAKAGPDVAGSPPPVTPVGGNVAAGPAGPREWSTTRPPSLADAPRPQELFPPPPAPDGSGPQVLASGGPGGVSAAVSAPGRLTPGSLPVPKVVNRRQVTLDFHVGKYGPSGLGRVEVYLTTNDGQTWEPAPGEPKVTLPVPVEGQGGAPVVGSVTVDLPPREDVTFGLYLVVRSRAGLGKPAPRPGDLPQIRVEVDTTPPVAELYMPQPDPARRDALLLTWKAQDKHLSVNPVSLEWAERPDGPWNFIGSAELPNSGKFSWPVPANVPPKVYLKLTARDTAGNSAVAQTGEPVLVDLTMPEVEAVNLAERPH